MATIEQLLVRVEERLYLAAGIGVQIHIEDTYIGLIRAAYERLFTVRWWDDLVMDKTYTLDGTTGHTTAANTDDFIDIKDIYNIFLEDYPNPLPRRSRQRNPNKQFGYCWAPTDVAGRVFKILPVTATGDVVVYYRKRLADSVWDNNEVTTEIPIDAELMTLTVCADAAVDAGLSQQIADKFAGQLLLVTTYLKVMR